jgi:hypothetical protein
MVGRQVSRRGTAVSSFRARLRAALGTVTLIAVSAGGTAVLLSGGQGLVTSVLPHEDGAQSHPGLADGPFSDPWPEATDSAAGGSGQQAAGLRQAELQRAAERERTAAAPGLSFGLPAAVGTTGTPAPRPVPGSPFGSISPAETRPAGSTAVTVPAGPRPPQVHAPAAPAAPAAPVALPSTPAPVSPVDVDGPLIIGPGQDSAVRPDPTDEAPTPAPAEPEQPSTPDPVAEQPPAGEEPVELLREGRPVEPPLPVPASVVEELAQQ